MPKRANKKTKRHLFLKLFLIFIIIIAVLGVRTFIAEIMLSRQAERATKEGGDYKGHLISGGLARSYLAHLPSGYDSNETYSLVLVLHGAGDNAEGIRKTTGMDAIADKNDFIVVYPNGTGLFNNYILSWNAGDCCNYVEPLGVDDVSFIRSLIDALQKLHNIDSDRIYVTGMSNGGMMVHCLGCNLSDNIAAIAPVSSSMWETEKCAPTDFLPVIIFHNIDDAVIPYYGGRSVDWIADFFDLKHTPVLDAVDFWVKHNHCSLSPQKIREGNVYSELYSDCEENADVLFYSISDGGHSWPGGKKGWFLGDKPVQDFSASEIIWSFFKTHPKI